MSARMEYKGSDVEEAISNACEALNVAKEQLEITIVSTGSSGIFGLGRKKAAVSVALKSPGGRREMEPVERGGEKAVAAKAAKPARPAKIRPPVSAEAEPAQPARPAKARTQVPAVADSDDEEVAGDPVSEAEMESIRQDLARILELMGFPSPLTVKQDQNNKVLAHISGDEVESLVGPEGQTLDGLEYIMRKIITRKFPQKVLFSLDAGEFRANRMQELQERAVRLASEVKETGKTRTIPAINPAERRIVHMALQNDTEIRSRSVGEGVFKKVLIYLPGKGRKRSSGKKVKQQIEG